MGLIIVDTNIVIYAIKGLKLVEPYLEYDFAVSEITIIELLGVKNIDTLTLNGRKKYLGSIINYSLTPAISEITIQLKQKYSLKIPDAIIAATALYFDLSLLTADKDFQKITELPSIIVSI